MESSHSEIDESDIEKRYSSFKKRSKAGGNQKSGKKQKKIIAKVSLVIFFTLPSVLRYFLMLQFFTNNSVKNVETIFFYCVSCLYSSSDI